MKTVSLVGSTGSIGTQAVEVIGADPGAYRVVAIGAATSVDALADQAELLRPERVALADPGRAGELAARLPPGVELLVGPEALAEIATGADVVVNGVVGFAGLPVTLAALQSRVPAGPGQQGVADRRRARRPGGPGDRRGRDRAGRLRALRHPPVPAGRSHGKRDGRPAAPALDARPADRADRQRRSFPGTASTIPGRGDRRGRPGPPDLEDGPEDHHRLVDADEQGPRGHRSP